MHVALRSRVLLGALLVGGLAACGGGGGGASLPTPPPAGLQIGQAAPLFDLQDTNPGSPSFGQPLGPAFRLGFGTAWYFAEASSPHSQAQFALLEGLVEQARLEDPPVLVDGLGVNAVGEEAGTPDMVDGRVAPWLQDTIAIDAWGLWVMEPDDLVILDTLGRVFAIYNLQVEDLGDATDFDNIKQTLRAAAQVVPPPVTPKR